MPSLTSKTFPVPLSITHIGTATALISIDGVNILTDPFFSPSGTSFPIGPTALINSSGPALTLANLPPIDAILLSHEDHPDNLDPLGRQLLDGRKVLTTVSGAATLAPRPGVVGLKPNETVTLFVGGQTFYVTATPCEHLPGGECIGFIISAEVFGKSADGKKNVIYFSGDTVYVPELAKIKEKYHVAVALLNLGGAVAVLESGPLTITMDGKEGARLFKEIGAEVLVPMHFESWNHFTQGKEGLEKVFEEEGVSDKVLWLEPGKETKVA